MKKLHHLHQFPCCLLRVNRLTKFLFSGLLNTFVGYVSFLIFFYLIYFSIEISNVLSYVIGVSMSYFLQKNYVFKDKNSNGIKIFIFFTFIAYVINLIILKITFFIGIQAYLCQIISMAFYSLSHFILLRLYVFNKEK